MRNLIIKIFSSISNFLFFQEKNGDLLGCNRCGWTGTKNEMIIAAEETGPFINFCPRCDTVIKEV